MWEGGTVVGWWNGGVVGEEAHWGGELSQADGKKRCRNVWQLRASKLYQAAPEEIELRVKSKAFQIQPYGKTFNSIVSGPCNEVLLIGKKLDVKLPYPRK